MEKHLIEKKAFISYKFKWLGVSGLFMLIVAYLWFWDDSKIPDAYKTPLFVKTAFKNHEIKGLGSITVRQSSLLDASDPGRIIELTVRLGQTVTKGQLLATLKNYALEQEYAEAQSQLINLESEVAMKKSDLLTRKYNVESQLAKAMATQKNQQLELRAYDQLVQSGVISKIKYQQAKIMLEQQEVEVSLLHKQQAELNDNYLTHLTALKSQVDSKKKQLKYLENRIKSLTIVAQVDGIISDINVALGQQVSQGDALFKLIEPKHLIAKIAIPQYSSDQIAVGQDALVRTPNGQLAAHIEYIDTVVRQGSVNLYLAFKHTVPDWIRSDQSIEAHIQLTEPTPYLFLDKPNTYQDEQQWQTYKFDQESGTAKKTILKYSRVANTLVFNEEHQLKEGDSLLLIPKSLALRETLKL